MSDLARYLKPLLGVGFIFVAAAYALSATGWSTPEAALQGTAIYWWSQQLNHLHSLLLHCAWTAVATAVVLVIATKVTARLRAQD